MSFFDMTTPEGQPSSLANILQSLAGLSSWGAGAAPSRMPVPFGMAANMAHQQQMQDQTQGLESQYKTLQVKDLQSQMDEKTKREKALQDLFAGMTPPASGGAPSAPLGPVPMQMPQSPPPMQPPPMQAPVQAPPQTPAAPAMGGGIPLPVPKPDLSAPAPAVPASVPQPIAAPVAPPSQSGFKLPSGFDSVEQFKAYATAFPEDAMKRVFAEHEYNPTPEKGINPTTGKPDEFVTAKDGTVKWTGIAPYEKPDKPDAAPEIVRTAEHLFPNDTAKQNAYIEKNSAANLRSMTVINNAAPALSADDRASAGAQAATGMPLAQIVPGFGKAAAGQRAQIRSDAIKKIQADTGMSAADAGIELANRTIEFQSGKKSSGQLTTMLGATKQAVSQLDFNINHAKAEMAKLPSSDLSPIVNAIARGEEKWTGNPAYSSLFYYMHASAVESARILSGGQSSSAQLHQGAMDEAQKWANINMTPASFDAVAEAMHEEGNNRIQTYQDALKSQRVGNAGADTSQPAPAAPPLAPTFPTPPANAIRDLKMRRDTAAFDAIFGPGAAAKALGTK